MFGMFWEGCFLSGELCRRCRFYLLNIHFHLFIQNYLLHPSFLIFSIFFLVICDHLRNNYPTINFNNLTHYFHRPNLTVQMNDFAGINHRVGRYYLRRCLWLSRAAHYHPQVLRSALPLPFPKSLLPPPSLFNPPRLHPVFLNKNFAHFHFQLFFTHFNIPSFSELYFL